MPSQQPNQPHPQRRRSSPAPVLPGPAQRGHPPAAAATRRTAILEHLGQHPGLTARELERATGHRGLFDLLQDMEADAQVARQARPWDGPQPSQWHVAPPGTVPPPRRPRRPLTPHQLGRREGQKRADRLRRVLRGLPSASALTLPPGAACQGEPPELFFPENGADEAKAKAICRRCPIRAACLEQARARGEKFGIWGAENLARTAAYRPAAGPVDRAVPLRALPPIDKAARLARLRAEHGTLERTARAAGMSPSSVSFYLTLLELSPDTQERVRSGVLSPADAVTAVRKARGTR
jgi:Transcription factor WhiB